MACKGPILGIYITILQGKEYPSVHKKSWLRKDSTGNVTDWSKGSIWE
jgi:hypothetical protein